MLGRITQKFVRCGQLRAFSISKSTLNMPGGWSEIKYATPETQGLVGLVKYQAELKVDKTFTAFEAKTFRTQVVAGTNFAVNVLVGPRQYAHLKVFQPLPGADEPIALTDAKVNENPDIEPNKI
ncbi:cystatin-A-like [Xenia sp. Carnegie-2017]|uniref:cystatin-A-like n=1 Tax=Xenia sp. Carnegie-2017 TaxID=2897299 RepID=UPI001F03C44E|nr:cystatin-A-like [Xenia sp. Carnegie-2017]